ncbi:restriction endonuclease subunit S [Ponticoccus sp. SC2-23]|uniref:restriction endonuclease subunit S n=1 Tax=Alexandriicola marinus TaxID=2081710 RepID=UPI000FDBE7B4|nr:restriction endonuclease subunit S [Alexandriicola marinus]MBM1222700.1 restriction endonuclease subunit S [Ponticoccus sp. SC6-9]MBM1231626.1 restriction endonuclease subunit S [Ponticoccus sp. SC6-38]MBM1236199.1 restriction endonuclease subunit S [Ponticoccus sp. SC6-45]MBM1240649.1 restriction endonuclease subunit S [Ponticoccus sp. SC6-49]MBM1245184.1 restriction endonuclease subunit S [Ponticoccus sp. SC2-64]MBM1249700.1 restriction endonuclease subunit S [Ponticoccus sp. SC6-42]MBM
MTDVSQLITEHLDVWTSSVEKKSGAGRGSGKLVSLHGIQRLRELILGLAVRGKLVPQEPQEGNATDLLSALAEEKRAALAEGLIKPVRGKLDGPADVGFELPENWAAVRLDEAAWSQAGFAFKSRSFNEIGAGFPLIRIRDVGKEFSGTFFEGPYREEFLVQNGDYLISMDGEFRVAPWRGPLALLNQRVSRLVFFSDLVVPEFIAIALQFELSALQGIKAYTTVDHLSGAQIASSAIPFPPTAEQHRIVAKVDELMGLCDTLEAQAEGSLKAHQTLVETCLAALANGQTPEDLAQNWARIEANFDALFTTEESIEKLRQTIYLLAIKGKLVAQDPDEVSAQHLLQEVADRRLELLEAGYPNEKEAKTQIKKSEKQTVPEGLQELPPGWEWATLMQASLMVIDCKNKTAPYSEDGVRLIRTTNVRNGRLNDTDQKYVDEKTFEAWSLRAKPEPGDLLITREAPMGEACLIPEGERLCLGQRMMLARLVPDTINKDYLLITFLAPDLMDRVQDKPLGMTVEHLRVGGVETLLVPIPPKAEQARIVDRVHRLVALCDEVKTRVQIAQGLQKTLSDTLVERAA